MENKEQNIVTKEQQAHANKIFKAAKELNQLLKESAPLNLQIGILYTSIKELPDAGEIFVEIATIPCRTAFLQLTQDCEG